MTAQNMTYEQIRETGIELLTNRLNVNNRNRTDDDLLDLFGTESIPGIK